MRKLVIAVLATVLVAACSRDTTAPATTNVTALSDATTTASSANGFGFFGGGVPGLNRLPDNLKLSADQQAAIKAAVTAFQQCERACQAAWLRWRGALAVSRAHWHSRHPHRA